LDMDKVKESGNKYSQGDLAIANLTRKGLLDLFTYQYILIAQKTSSAEILNAAGENGDAPGNCLSPHFEQDNSVPGLSSIIILTCNQLEYTKKCVKSLRKHMPEPHEIIFVDNGSTDGTVKWLKALTKENKDYKLIENKLNLGFAKGCNQGIEASRGEYILLLNNDVVVAEGWLSGMLDCLKTAPDAGIIGPMTNNISGVQQVVSDEYRSVEYLDKYAGQFREKHRHRRIPLRRIVGFCMLFTRALAQQIGLLDESFGTGNFEDDDFCLRAALAGHRNYIAGDVFIHHYGSRSFIGNKIDYGTAMSGNRKIIEKKWTLNSQSEAGKKLAVLKTTELADDLYQKGMADQAVGALIECIKLTPDAKGIYYELARIFLESKKFSEAWEVIESMPETARNELKGLECAGYAKQGLGLDDEAGAYAERMLSLDGKYPAALNLKGVLAYTKGEKEKAAGDFRKAIDADPGYGEARTNLGVLCWGMDNQDEALVHLRKGFALSPATPDTRSLYYSVVSSLGAFADAEAEFREACRLYPNNKTLAFLYIDILIQQGKFDLAMTRIEDALALFGIDDGTLNAALAVREKIGPLRIRKSSKKRTLSLCMIVKNEEKYLVKCLRSVRDVVDEMVVVDTGSTDKTIDIATVFGARVFNFPWTDDFSAARNHSLQQATGDWILILDADEAISASDVCQLRTLIQNKTSAPTAYTIVTRNYTNNVSVIGWTRNSGQYPEEAGVGWVKSFKVRLFTRRKDVFFSNPVHEALEDSLKNAKIPAYTSDIIVHHYGKLNMEREEQKNVDYYMLGKMKYESDPSSVKYINELAKQAQVLHKYEEAVELWLKLISLLVDPESPGYKEIARISYGEPLPEIYIQLAAAYLMLDRYEEALATARKAMEAKIKLKEYVQIYAHCEIIVGSLSNAFAALEELLKTTPDYTPALFMMAVISCLEGRKEKAQELFQKLLRERVQITPLLNKIAKQLHANEKGDEALVILEAMNENRLQDEETGGLIESLRKSQIGI
ncbi:MAG: glycosyltransferase, partial [Syntrophales bacterium]